MPQLSKVGDGWGGSEDYATLNAWWAAESGVDYGGPIEAQCKGVVSTSAITTFDGTPPYRPKIYTDSVTYDGTNDSLLSSINRMEIRTPVEIYDMAASSTSTFSAVCNLLTGSDGTSIYRCMFEKDALTGDTDIIRVSVDNSNTTIENNVLLGGQNTVDFGFGAGMGSFQNNILAEAVQDGYDGSGDNDTLENCLAFNNGGQDYQNLTGTNNASEDGTGNITGYGSGDLVNYAGRDFRTALSSPLHALGVGAFFETGGGGQTIELSSITLSPTLHSPELKQDKLITLGNLTSTLVNYDPTVTVDKLIVAPTLLSTLVVRNPSLSNDKLILSPEIPSVAVTFSPEILGPQVIGPEFIIPRTVVRMPNILKDKLIITGELSTSASIRAPEVTGGFRVDPDLKLFTAEGYGMHIRSGEKLLEKIEELQLRVKLLEKDQS